MPQIFDLLSVDSGCHKLSENIWFVRSKTSYSGDKWRCYRCGTDGQVKIVLLSFWSGKRWVSQFYRPHSQSIFYLSIPVHSVKLAQPPVFGASSLSCFEKQIIKCKVQLGESALDPPVVPAWWGVAPNNSQRETSPKTLNQNCTVVHALMLCNKSNPLLQHCTVLC